MAPRTVHYYVAGVGDKAMLTIANSISYDYKRLSIELDDEMLECPLIVGILMPIDTSRLCGAIRSECKSDRRIHRTDIVGRNRLNGI